MRKEEIGYLLRLEDGSIVADEFVYPVVDFLRVSGDCPVRDSGCGGRATGSQLQLIQILESQGGKSYQSLFHFLLSQGILLILGIQQGHQLFLGI